MILGSEKIKELSTVQIEEERDDKIFELVKELKEIVRTEGE